MNECDSRMQRVKQKIHKLQDKIQAKVEDIYDDIQETVHTQCEKLVIHHTGKNEHKFLSHLSASKEDISTKLSDNLGQLEPTAMRKTTSLENLSSERIIEEKSNFTKKIHVIRKLLTVKHAKDEGGNLKLSKSEINLLENELMQGNESSPVIKIDEPDENGDVLIVPVLNIQQEDSKIVEDDRLSESGASCASDYSQRSCRKESNASMNSPVSGRRFNSCDVMLEKIGHHFPKLKEKGDIVHRYFQRNTRLYDVNKKLKCQIWSSVVTIVLVEAKGLTAMDQDTSSSDPYVKFRLGSEKYKSKVIWRSLNPCWLEQFDLHLYDDQEQLLELTVWDRDKQSKDDFLGRCLIDLSMLEREKTHNIWKDLEEGNGQIFLLLTISGTTSSETITDLTNYQDNPKERQTIENRFVWHRLGIWNEAGSGGVGWLCVKVFGAKGLAAADLGGKSDPFCVIELVNARLQTHTEYKTLSPNWMKIFTFNVKDISSVLEITVYDEDHDHKVEFLGKLSLPLLNIKNGDKRWFALKDKKMRARAKGNSPQILLEMTVIWNPIKASIRAINPKEEKYMQTEVKFKRQVFLRNVMRLKSIIMWFIEMGKILQACFEWESRLRSFIALLGWIVACYYFEPWMAPFSLLLLFGRNWLISWLTGGSHLHQPVDDEELLAEEDEDDPDQEEEKKSLKERLQAIQEVTQSVQNSIGYMASLGEEVKNLFNFTVPYLSLLAVILLLAASLVLFLIPVRYLLMLWGINKFARKILRPHTIPNNEVLDLLSRVPNDEELLDFRELKTHPTTEARRDARKKHKAS